MSDQFRGARRRLIETLQAGGIRDLAVLQAFDTTPRHVFVPTGMRHRAYEDSALPIGNGQTISQPSTHARYLELLRLTGKEKVLEIGTGSGYQAAVLAEIVDQVYTIEILAPLGRQAQNTLERLGYTNIHVRIGDGYRGWPEKAPFDAILVTAAPPQVPRPLLEQVKVGGRIVLPVGQAWQDLRVMTKLRDGSFETRSVAPVRFVPMTGQAQRIPPR
jgi:protein-L-isoaspartate(D-aspartate) O-methyltransferase